MACNADLFDISANQNDMFRTVMETRELIIDWLNAMYKHERLHATFSIVCGLQCYGHQYCLEGRWNYRKLDIVLSRSCSVNESSWSFRIEKEMLFIELHYLQNRYTDAEWTLGSQYLWLPCRTGRNFASKLRVRGANTVYGWTDWRPDLWIVKDKKWSTRSF